MPVVLKLAVVSDETRFGSVPYTSATVADVFVRTKTFAVEVVTPPTIGPWVNFWAATGPALAKTTTNGIKIGPVALKIRESTLAREPNRREIFKRRQMLKKFVEFVKSIAAMANNWQVVCRQSHASMAMETSSAWALLHWRQDYGCTVQNPVG